MHLAILLMHTDNSIDHFVLEIVKIYLDARVRIDLALLDREFFTVDMMIIMLKNSQ